MKINASLLLVVSLLSIPVAAEQNDLTLWLSSQRNNGGGRFSAETDARAHFNNGNGFGVALGHMFAPAVSGEIAAFRTSSDGDIRSGSERVKLGNIKLTPVTAMARYHFLTDRAVGFYAGGGAAYVLVSNLNSADLRGQGLSPVSLDNKVAPVLNGGLTFAVSPAVGVAVDARYIPLQLEGHAANAGRAKTDLNPMMVSVGLKMKF